MRRRLRWTRDRPTAGWSATPGSTRTRGCCWRWRWRRMCGRRCSIRCFVRNAALDRPLHRVRRPHGAAGRGVPAHRRDGALPHRRQRPPEARADALRLFAPEHPLRARGLLRLDSPPEGAPAIAGTLALARDQVAVLTTGRADKPDHAADFPARRLTTRLGRGDLVLAPEVMDQIDHIAAWLAHERRILDDWGLRRTLAPGYRALFYGPPGTGKTLTAALIGQQAASSTSTASTCRWWCRNTSARPRRTWRGVFDQAAHRSWILFFDEADALFGARTAHRVVERPLRQPGGRLPAAADRGLPGLVDPRDQPARQHRRRLLCVASSRSSASPAPTPASACGSGAAC